MKSRLSTDTHEAAPPRSFRERLQSLAGQSTWREPLTGHSTQQRAIPAAHELAAALGMARDGKDDVGPDIACDVIFGRTAYAGVVCRTVATAMSVDRARAIKRCRPWLRVICWAAYCELVHGSRQDQLRPDDVLPADWDMLTDAASRIMEVLADEAVNRAARAWRREKRVA